MRRESGPVLSREPQLLATGTAPLRRSEHLAQFAFTHLSAQRQDFLEPVRWRSILRRAIARPRTCLGTLISGRKIRSIEALRERAPHNPVCRFCISQRA